MLTTAFGIAKQVVESALSIVGIRVGTEEPRHTSERLTDRVEIRTYGPRIAAETTVAADEDAARNEGFRRLAGYIFGRNQSDDKIAMTAPVGQAAERADVGEGWVIRFFMPSECTMATLPTPTDERVRLTEVPPETVAVLTFSGDRSPRAIADYSSRLLDTLRDKDISVTGDVAAWFYDPPWTLPFRRRNEVVVPVNA